MATKLTRVVQFAAEFSNFAKRAETRKVMDRFSSGGCALLKLLRSQHRASVEANPKTSRLFSAVCVQRLPLITRERTELEKRFQDLQERLELEHSMLSDDEVQLNELQYKKKILGDDDDEERIAIAKAEADRKEFEDEQEEEWMKFHPGGRETEADKLNDLKSLNRKLEETLILLVKKHPDAKTWEVPHGEVDSSTKSLKEVAAVALVETCGSDLSVQFFSGIPIAVLKAHNAKVFFYKASYLKGSVSLQEDYCDYVWLTKNEIKDYVDPDYYKTLKRFLS